MVSRLLLPTITPCSDSLSLRLHVFRRLTLPEKVTRRFIMQKARRHNKKLLRPLVGARFQGLFHTSIRSAFHLSFTVLVRYRSLGSMFTCTIGLSRRTLHTVRFDSSCGFACRNQHLHPLTDYSVSPRHCHCSVSTSLLEVVPEY